MLDESVKILVAITKGASTDVYANCHIVASVPEDETDITSIFSLSIAFFLPLSRTPT